MTLGEFVYPPILNSSQPAYDYYKKDLVINFTIPSMVSINDIGAIGITIVSQSNNTSVLLENDYLYFDFNNSSNEIQKINNFNNDYQIIINKENYLNLNKYQPGKLYKVQLNFIESFWNEIPLYQQITEYNDYITQVMEGTEPNKQGLLDSAFQAILNDYPTLIKNTHYYRFQAGTQAIPYWVFYQEKACRFIWESSTIMSEWSSVMLIKPITIPELTIGLPNERGTLADKFKETSVEVIYVERSLNPLFTGTCIFSQPNENEVEDQYKFFLYENDQLISETDWLTHKANETNDQYSFDQMLKENTYYSVGYQIKTNNGYISDIKQKNFVIELPDLGKLEGVTLRTEPYSEDGYMNVYLNSSEEIQSNFILSRAAENTNFQKWENLGYITNYLQAGDQLVYQDYTVESGIKYLYALTEEIRYDDYSEYKSPLYEGEEGKLDTSKAKSVDFEYAFLYSKGKQLKLKFNNKMSSFKKSVLASKQDTIGSQYPTILRNGQAYYAEFPITGLISLQMDDNQTFFTLGEEGYYYDDELIIPKDKLQNSNYRESTNTDQSCSPWTSTDLVDDNIFIERKFREKVEEFLNNGECKLYRSPTEGNFIINLLNISFTPNQTLGRMIYEFNSTAYEIDEVNIKNLEKLDILKETEYQQLKENEVFLSKIEEGSENRVELLGSKWKRLVFSNQNQESYTIYIELLLNNIVKEVYEYNLESDFIYECPLEYNIRITSTKELNVQWYKRDEVETENNQRTQEYQLKVNNTFETSTYIFSLKAIQDSVDLTLKILLKGIELSGSGLDDLFTDLLEKTNLHLINPITKEEYTNKSSLNDQDLYKCIFKLKITNLEDADSFILMPQNLGLFPGGSYQVEGNNWYTAPNKNIRESSGQNRDVELSYIMVLGIQEVI